MARSNYGGPKLPKTLLDQVGGVGKKGGRDTSRKDRRKAERQAKKGGRVQNSAAARRAPVRLNHEDTERISRTEQVRERPSKDAEPVKSILKASRTLPVPTAPAISDDESTADTELEDLDSEEEDNGGDVLSDVESDDSFTISRQAAKAGLADEDDEIAALERKLGVKSKKSSNVIGDDELDWLVTGSDSEDEGRTKRKRPNEDAKWLRDKRQKMNRVEQVSSSENEDEAFEDASAEDGESDGIENPFSEDELSEDFGGFESEDDGPPSPKRERENPYKAPVSKDTTVGASGKYVPPSLRKAASSDEEVLKQLRRQIQGQLNRLSDANLLSILQAVEQIYEKSARQHVTSTLIDLLVGLVTDPAILNDTFLILHAGFVAALYKVVGTDFGAQLLERLVEVLDGYRQSAENSEGKQQLNLVAFMSTLYAFQVISSAILFDYMRMFLSELTEDNTELLLRIIRTSGTQLRKDDPTALKDIVLLLQRQVAEAGEANISVRTRYMIDTIRDLKNNRMKTGVANSAVVAEHTTRMRKILGTLNTRPLRAPEPLRITLSDIRDSEKKGKWWLVGASYHDPSKLATSNSAGGRPDTTTTSKSLGDTADGYESDTPGHVNLTKAARVQGMNTDIRRLIFINIVGAEDYIDAYQRLQGLKLRSKQLAEIPGVLVHCTAVERGWNPFYGFLARRLCEDGGKTMQKGFQSTLWSTIKKLADGGVDGDDDDVDDDEGRDELTMVKVVILAKFYGFLIASGLMSIAATKTLDYGLLSRPDGKAYVFAEAMLTMILLQGHKKTEDYESKVREIFSGTARAPQMVQGLGMFVGNVISRANLAKKKKEERIIMEGCEVVSEVLRKVGEEAVRGLGVEEGSESE